MVRRIVAPQLTRVQISDLTFYYLIKAKYSSVGGDAFIRVSV
jgi:hypothetical protein